MPRKMRQSGVDWIGEIPEDWGVRRLRFVADITTGDHDTQDADPNGTFPFYVRSPNVERAMDYTFDGDGILMAGDGAGAGRVFHIATGKYAVHQRVYRLYDFRGVNVRLLWYYLSSTFPNVMDRGSAQSTVPSVRMPMLLDHKVVIPQDGEQDRIVAYLDSRCAEINEVIEKTKLTINDYRLLKKTLVFEAVTGKNLKGKKVASGQDWLGDIPAAWDVRRIVNLYREVSERGDDSLPILSVSINTGVSDKELSDEEQERVFIRSEDKSKYKRVQPGDLTYNMMRAWQGAFGAVRVNGMVSPAYVVARPKVEMDSRYVEYLLRSPNATREMQRYSRGIADFRLRLYWPEFKNIRIPCPPLAEQRRIADMLDEKCGEIDAVIADKERLIADLETYKKSLIFEVVTGKREVA